MADCVRGLSLDRIQGLQEALRDQKFDAALLFYSRDIYYYTGTAQPSYLFVSPDDYFLFVRSGMNFARREVFIEPDRMKEERRLENVFQALSFRFPGKRLGTELDLMTFNNYRKWENIFTGCEFFDASPLILEQRKTKDLDELDRIREFYEGLKDIADHVISRIRPGMECREAFALAEARAEGNQLGDAFLSFPGGRKSHMIGHGVGLECSEPPIVSRRESSRLGEDYVMAIEMHAAREGVGVVKLEDMIHIGRHKNVLLTRSPRTLSETG